MKVLARARGSGGVWPRAVFGPVDKFGIFTPPWFMISLDSCRVRLAYECSVDVLGTCRKGTRLMQTKKKTKKKTKESEMGWNGRSRRLRELWIIHFLLIFYTSLFGIDFLLHFVLFFF
jgi:hypothetical protein